MRGRVFFRRRWTPRSRALLLLWSFFLALIVLLGVAASHLRPILTNMATARVTNTISHVVTDAVSDCVSSGAITYDALVTFEKGEGGEITAVKSNMAEFSRLQALILDDIYNRISEVSSRDLSIPLGSLTGVSLLAGRGPAIKVRIQSVGSASAFFENQFMDAGINQTKHQIVLKVNVAVSIFLPGYITSAKVSSQYTVAETIIVGSVPDTYTYFNSATDELVEDYILNNG